MSDCTHQIVTEFCQKTKLFCRTNLESLCIIKNDDDGQYNLPNQEKRLKQQLNRV